MGSMVIFHYNNNLTDDQLINVMMPGRLNGCGARASFFNLLMSQGHYSPAYVINCDDLDVAFDTGNGYAPAGVEYIEVPKDNCHTSTSVGDIVVINGTKKMLVMPSGFEEI